MTVIEDNSLLVTGDIQLDSVYDFADHSDSVLHDIIDGIKSMSQDLTTLQYIQKADEILSAIANLQASIEAKLQTIKQAATRAKHNDAKYQECLFLDSDLKQKDLTVIRLASLVKKRKMSSLLNLNPSDITNIAWSVDVDDEKGPLILYSLIIDSQQIQYTVCVSDVKIIRINENVAAVHTDYDFHLVPKEVAMGIKICFKEHLQLINQ